MKSVKKEIESLQNKIERLEKDNRVMLLNLKENFKDFNHIKSMLKTFMHSKVNIDVDNAVVICKGAIKATKKYARRKTYLII